MGVLRARTWLMKSPTDKASPSVREPTRYERSQAVIPLRVILSALLVVMVCAAPGQAAENAGAAQMTLPGGGSGSVPFPHQAHQTALKDCQLCHGSFPQQPGAIETLKAQGALESKQVMNKQCIACHKQKKTAGEKSGPITCTGCHQK